MGEDRIPVEMDLEVGIEDAIGMVGRHMVNDGGGPGAKRGTVLRHDVGAALAEAAVPRRGGEDCGVSARRRGDLDKVRPREYPLRKARVPRVEGPPLCPGDGFLPTPRPGKWLEAERTCTTGA